MPGIFFPIVSFICGAAIGMILYSLGGIWWAVLLGIPLSFIQGIMWGSLSIKYARRY